MTTHKWKDIEHKRDQRIAKLIAQARGLTPTSELRTLTFELANALEAAEAEVKKQLRINSELSMANARVGERLEAAMAERDRAVKEARAAVPLINAKVRENRRLREALDWIEAEPEDPLKVQLWARAALAGSGDG